MIQEPFLKKSVDWLLHSGIQNIGSDKDKEGGLNCWFDLDTGGYKYIYSEITGYGITALILLYHKYKNPLFLERAALAYEWLARKALRKDGGVLTRHYLEEDKEKDKYSFESGVAYSFDAGMVLFGVVNLYKELGRDDILDTAKKIGNFLVNKCRRPDGAFYAYYDSINEKPVSNFDKWSTQSGSFHAKIAMGLLVLYEVAGEEKYLEAARCLCDSALKFQEKNGRFVNLSDKGATHLHPHLYSCEGLMFVGEKLKKSEYTDAAVRGAGWATDNAINNGAVNYFYDGAKWNDFERVDALGQLLRLACYCLQNNLLNAEYKSKIDWLADRLLTFQRASGLHEGGFYYGCTDDGKRPPHITSWTSMFSLQAIDFYLSLLSGKKIDLDYLI